MHARRHMIDFVQLPRQELRELSICATLFRLSAFGHRSQIAVETPSGHLTSWITGRRARKRGRRPVRREFFAGQTRATRRSPPRPIEMPLEKLERLLPADAVPALEERDVGAIRQPVLRVEPAHLRVLVGDPTVSSDAIVMSTLDHEGTRKDEVGHLGVVEGLAEIPVSRWAHPSAGRGGPRPRLRRGRAIGLGRSSNWPFRRRAMDSVRRRKTRNARATACRPRRYARGGRAG